MKLNKLASAALLSTTLSLSSTVSEAKEDFSKNALIVIGNNKIDTYTANHKRIKKDNYKCVSMKGFNTYILKGGKKLTNSIIDDPKDPIISSRKTFVAIQGKSQYCGDLGQSTCKINIYEFNSLIGKILNSPKCK